MLKTIAIYLVAAAVVLLIGSLFPTRAICHKKQRVCRGWKFLGVLIVLFIVGYLLFIYMLVVGPTSFWKFVVSMILFGGSIFVFFVVRLSDISIKRVEKMAEQERHRALHDALTELPNRALLEERLDYAILMAKRRNESFVLLMMDLVRFKEINDSLGHFYGDYVLQEVAIRLRNQVRESDTLARVGGDEFAYILPEVNVEQAIAICRKISRSIDQPFNIEGYKLQVGISIGVVMYPDHAMESETLLQRGDAAMYEAKRNDVMYAVFDPDHDQATLDRLIMIGELREAIAKDQLFLDYQPKVCAEKRGVVGVEALVRWQHPRHGLVSPDQFIPLVEQAGLSKHLTNWVLDHAFRQSSLWKQAGRDIIMAVNLSVKNLHDYELPHDVARSLHKWNVDPSMVVLEITESCMMTDQQRVSDVVAKLMDLGLQLSIDDFGTGYSSVAYLRKFPAKEIKIDRSFVTDMLENTENAIIVRSTIEMIHNIGCLAIAEGVEDEETCRELSHLGCDCLQGFHISRPLSPEKLDEWFNAESWRFEVHEVAADKE